LIGTTPAAVAHQLDREHTCVEHAASLLSSGDTDSLVCPAQTPSNFDVDSTLVLDRFRTPDLWGSAN